MNSLMDTLLNEAIEISLAASAACLLILLVGHRCRQLFGARVSYLLWLLLPASVLAVLLPAPQRTHTALELVSAEPGVAVGAPQSLAEIPAEPLLALAPVLLALWALGAAIALWTLWRQQRRFRASLGRLRTRPDGALMADARSGLPAVVGLRPKVVLPADFEQRFSPEQQALVIAHERIHAQRGDVLWNALFALLGALQWFNPLLRVAYRRFRQDQELACDARVLSLHPQARRAYAEALLDSPNDSPAAPLACPAFGTHPLKERIAMLSRPLPSARRLLIGAALALSLSAAAAGLAWAKQTPSETPMELLSTRIEASLNGGPVQRPHLISPAGDAYGFRMSDAAGVEWEAELRAVPDGEDRYRVDLRLSREGELMSSPRLLLHAGEQGGVQVAAADGSIALALQLQVTTAAADPAPPAPPAPPAAPSPQGLPSTANAPAAPAPLAIDAPAPPAPPTASSPPLPPAPPNAPEREVRYRSMTAPAYPKESVVAREQGVVVLRVRVAADGRPQQIEIAHSSGSTRLDEAASASVENWTFEPALRDGQATDAWIQLPVKFSMDEHTETIEGFDGALDIIEIKAS